MTQELYEFFHPATGCAHCPTLAVGRHTVVWGKGPPNADLMCIGDAPNYADDMQGLPFAKRLGQHVDQIMRDADLDPFDIHYANRLMCRAANDRDFSQEEFDNCYPWLVEHIRNVNPEGIALFGPQTVSLMFDTFNIPFNHGLMSLRWCDACGQPENAHGYRWATDGNWTLDAEPCLSGIYTKERVVASMYHPAACIDDKNPDQRTLIVNEMRRLAGAIR